MGAFFSLPNTGYREWVAHVSDLYIQSWSGIFGLKISTLIRRKVHGYELDGPLIFILLERRSLHGSRGGIPVVKHQLTLTETLRWIQHH